MLSSKDYLEEDFDDLKDVEFIESFASKQIKQMKSSRKPTYISKKSMLREKRKEKEINILQTLKGDE